MSKFLNKLYSKRFRIYLLFAFLCVLGFYCFDKMSMSLFPESSRPQVKAVVPYADMPREKFIQEHGLEFETELKSITKKDVHTKKLTAIYSKASVTYDMTFDWGDDDVESVKSVIDVFISYKSTLNSSNASKLNVTTSSLNSGYLVGSLNSSELSCPQLYNIFNNSIAPMLKNLESVYIVQFKDPVKREIIINTNHYKLQQYNISIEEIYDSIKNQEKIFSSGSIWQNNSSFQLQIKNPDISIDDIKYIKIEKENSIITLDKLADISVYEKIDEDYKVDGANVLNIIVIPKKGHSVAKMSNDVISTIDEYITNSNYSSDLSFSTFINPAVYVERAVNNILHEIAICSMIAVFVLFFFIGSIGATLTTCIEIPLSIIVSFILLYITGIDLNLISLGGIALSVGMNVDASIVVIDSIMKHLKGAKKDTSVSNIISRVSDAVAEVAIPLLLATLTSLVVFLPIYFTSKLTFAVLGDLAIAVIYSHTISLFIALILIPAVRVTMFAKNISHASDSSHSIKFIERVCNKIYKCYDLSLKFFLSKKILRIFIYSTFTISLVASVIFIPVELKREIISNENSDILYIGVIDKSRDSDVSASNVAEKISRYLNVNFEGSIDHIQTSKDSDSYILLLVKLNDISSAKVIKARVESKFKEMEDFMVFSGIYNPSQMPLPVFKDIRIEISSIDNEDTVNVANELFYDMKEFSNIRDFFNESTKLFSQKTANSYRYILKPKQELLHHGKSVNYNFTLNKFSKYLNQANSKYYNGDIYIGNNKYTIYSNFGYDLEGTQGALAFPVEFDSKIIPLRALFDLEKEKTSISIIRVDGAYKNIIQGDINIKGSENDFIAKRKKYLEFVEFIEKFKQDKLPKISSSATVKITDHQVELTEAIDELTFSIALSMLLIFVCLYLRFADISVVFTVMLAIPFGILGVLLSLYVFDSTISLNSSLGVILLNGIAVANSILLVEKIKEHENDGLNSTDLVLLAARERIRPILMTTLTTVLGMLPIAIGFGEGGKVLQPLGIAVCGGLWVSLIFTLFVVPAAMRNIINRRSKVLIK